MSPAPFLGLEVVFGNVLKIALSLVGVVVVVMIVVSGFQYLGAGADKEGAARARNTLTFAIIGLIVAISAWLILSLFGQFLGVDLGVFKLEFPAL